jgi:outer membrane cobalamin receptor
MNKTLLTIALCCCLNMLIGQDQNVPKPLVEVLQRLEMEHNIKFSYSDDVLNNLSLVYEETSEDITEIIRYLQEKTGLRFKLVSKKRYAIFFPTEKQTLCGFLYDSGTRNVLADASVITNRKTQGTASNAQGFFELTGVYPKDTLQISIIGYKTFKKTVADFLFKDCLAIYMEEEATNLNEVIVTDYLTNAITKTIDGAIVFKPKSQTVLPGLTESDALFTVQQVPGILNVDETASGLHIRGGSPDQNLILYNGIKLFHTAHFFGAISAVNPQNIDKMTVYKTASNAKYGNHIAGVVDIESTSKISESLSGSVGANLMNFDANVTIPIASKMSLSVSGRRSLTDVFDTPTKTNFSERAFQFTLIDDNNQLVKTIEGDIDTDFYFYDYSARWNYRPSDKDYLSLNAVGIKNNLNHRFSSTELEERTEDNLELENSGYSVQWQRQWNADTHHEIYASYSNYGLQVSNEKFQIGEEAHFAFIDKDNALKNVDIGLDINHRLNKRSSVTLGYQYSHNDVVFELVRKNEFLFKEEFLEENDANNTHSLFGEYRLKSNKDYVVNVGLRSNYFSLLDEFSFEPRLFAQLRILPKLWLNSSFDIKQQNISKITESHTKDFGLENEAWVLSNNDRVPLLKSRQLTFGAVFERDSWLIDIDLFRRKIEGLTSITSGFEINRGFFLGEGTSAGLDVLVKKNWGNYNIWVSYHTGKTSFMFDEFNNNEKFDGNFDVSHALYWSNHFRYKRFDLSLGWTYRVGVPFTSAFISDLYFIARNAANAERLPDYHRMDVSCTYSFFLDRKNNIRVEAGIAILNLYDKRNILQRNYDIADFDNPDGGTLIQEDIKSIGFTPNLSFRVKF